MNTKLILTLLQTKSQEKGFVLPLVLTTGLVIILFGATMMIKAQETQVSAIAKKQTARTLSIDSRSRCN